MFDSIPFSSLRLLALILHFVLTTGLVWTRYDSLQVTLKATATETDYEIIESSYLSLISFGIISLVIEMLMVVAAPHHVSLFGALKLFLDVVGSFFIAWIILDGLEWLTYVYIFVFCVILPTVGDIAIFSVQIHKNIWVDWRRTKTIFQMLWDVMVYIWSWLVYIGGCFCPAAPAEVAPPSALVATCLGCVAWFREEGFTGMASSCWRCCSSAASTSPTALFAGCWTTLSGCCTGTGAWCSSLSTALMRGPTGVMEFCSAGVASCGSQDSLVARMRGCAGYCWTSTTGAVSYVANACTSCWRQYGPVLYNALIAVRDFVWSWLVWFWRQVRLFFT